MALRHAILTRLSRGLPRSGYELSAHFSNNLEPAWNASTSQVYAELRKMEESGLLNVHDRSERGRTSYEISAKGQEEIEIWLKTIEVDRSVRNDSLMRMLMVWTLDETTARHLIQGEIAFYRKRIMYLRQIVEEWDGRNAPIFRHRLAGLLLWITQDEGMIAWLNGLALVIENPETPVTEIYNWPTARDEKVSPPQWHNLNAL